MRFPRNGTYPINGSFPNVDPWLAERPTPISRETVAGFTRDTMQQLAPMPAVGTSLLDFVSALGSVVEPVEQVTRRQGSRPGWAAAWDVQRVDAGWLPWVGQFRGLEIAPVSMEVATAVAKARVDILRPPHEEYGTLPAMIRIAKEHLTGTKTVFAVERAGSAYRAVFSTFIDETPDPERLNAELQKQKPAGIILVHSVISRESWLTVRDTHSTWQDVKDTYSTWGEVLADPDKQ
jgi:hypothetical protein